MYLLIEKNFDSYSSFELMMASLLADHKQEIVSKLEQFNPELKDQVLNDYEGGIDEWWCPSGSVMQDELGLITKLEIRPDGCILGVYLTGQSDYE